MTKKLTADQKEGRTPEGQLRLWISLFPEEVFRLRNELGYPDESVWRVVFASEVIRMCDWLRRYEHSARSKKTDWYKFMKNWIPKYGGQKHGNRRPQNGRRIPSQFADESGEREM